MNSGVSILTKKYQQASGKNAYVKPQFIDYQCIHHCTTAEIHKARSSQHKLATLPHMQSYHKDAAMQAVTSLTWTAARAPIT